MDVQPVSLNNALTVDYHDLDRQMAEILELRGKVASLEKATSMNRQRAEKAGELCAERRA
jgi:hypothetical protein